MKVSKKLLEKFSSSNSIQKVVIVLEQLDDSLSKTELIHLRAFNHAYIIITKQVNRKMIDGYIKHTKEMGKLDINFARLYFEAVKNYFEEKKIPKAWQMAFDFYKSSGSNQLIYLMLGANAHINNDLAFSLKETIQTEDFGRDYKRVQRVIDRSIDEIMRSLNEQYSAIISVLYPFILKVLMRTWRKNAWENYMKLKMNRIKAEDIEENSAKTAQMIIFVAGLFSRKASQPNNF